MRLAVFSAPRRANTGYATNSRLGAEIGSSGWIRTSNPPVNSNQGAGAPSLDTETCEQVDLMRMLATIRCGKLRPNLQTGAFLPV